MINPFSVAVIGHKGMLGSCFAPLLEKRGIKYHGFDLPELDMTDEEKTRKQLTEIHPAVVINCAAYTDVDGAEKHEDDALRVNRDGPAVLTRICKDLGAVLVHYSTDYVFPGDADHPYEEDAPIKPVNAYGRTKAEGERVIKDIDGEYLIIRSSWLYAAHGKNFVETIARLSREKDELRVLDDQRGRPTSCPVLAEATLELLDLGARGVFHVAGGGEATWYEFASAIAATVNPGCQVNPCNSDEFPRPAARPVYSVLDLSKTEKLIGPMPFWRDSLTDVLKQMGY